MKNGRVADKTGAVMRTTPGRQKEKLQTKVYDCELNHRAK